MATAKAGERSSKSLLPYQICLFDSRRGEKEGEEDDKILGFYPGTVPLHEQSSIVGLLQATLTFSSTFDPVKPFESIQTEHSRWIVLESEPHLWLLLVVTREWSKGPVREQGLRASLRQFHQLFTLVHGSLQLLLNQDSSGQAVRAAVRPALDEFGTRMAQTRGPEYSALHNPLAAIEAVPYLHLPQSTFLSMQSMVNRVLLSPALNGAAVTGLVLLHEHWMLWSTLDQAATKALYQLFVWSILPAIRAASQTSFGRRLRSSRSTAESFRSLLSKSVWELQQNGLMLLSGDPPSTAQSGPEHILHTPCIYVESIQEWCSLLVMRIADEVLLVLLPEESPATVSAAEGSLDLVTPLMRTLSSSVAQHLQAVRRQHVPLFRYLFVDESLEAVRASPGSKVATLARGSLALINSVRAELEAQRGAEQEYYAEVAVWGQQDCWVLAKQSSRKLLVSVLEQQGKEGLLDACSTADTFALATFPFAFH